MVLPVAFALFEYFRRGGFDPETGLDNSDETLPEPLPAEVLIEPVTGEAIPYRPLPAGRRIAAVCALAIAAIVAIISGPGFGARPSYRLSETDIRASASRFLNELGQKADSYRVVASPDQHWSGPDQLAGKYMLERLPLSAVESLLERYRPVHHWMVRFFRPLEKEESEVSVHPETGQVLGFHHDLPEDQAGADLPEAEARNLATSFATAHGFDTGSMELKESSSEKRKARRDYTLIWEAKPGDSRNAGEARYRLEIGVDGDRVTAWRTYWKVPEAFERERSQRNLVSIFVLVLRITLFGILGVIGMWLLIDRTRRHELRWGQAVRYAVPLALLGLVSLLLGYSQMYRSYPTAIPLATYQTTVIAGMVMGAAGLMLLGSLLFALLLCLYPQFRDWLTDRSRARLGLDALIIAALVTALAAAQPAVTTWAMSKFPALALPQVSGAEVVVSAFPALSAMAAAAQHTVQLLVLAGLVAFVWKITAGRRWLAFLTGLVALGGMLPGDVQTWGEFAFYFVDGLAAAVVIAAVCLWLARDNVLAYVLAAWTVSLSSAAAGLFAQHNPRLNFNGWLVVVVLLLSLAWAVSPSLIRMRD